MHDAVQVDVPCPVPCGPFHFQEAAAAFDVATPVRGRSESTKTVVQTRKVGSQAGRVLPECECEESCGVVLECGQDVGGKAPGTVDCTGETEPIAT